MISKNRNTTLCCTHVGFEKPGRPNASLTKEEGPEVVLPEVGDAGGGRRVHLTLAQTEAETSQFLHQTLLGDHRLVGAELELEARIPQPTAANKERLTSW